MAPIAGLQLAVLFSEVVHVFLVLLVSLARHLSVETPNGGSSHRGISLLIGTVALVDCERSKVFRHWLVLPQIVAQICYKCETPVVIYLFKGLFGVVE